MAAFIPSRRDPEVNEAAMAKVRDDKTREAGDGFDGSWVAHPDLVPMCREVFDAVLGDRPNQLDRHARGRVTSPPSELLDVAATPGEVTEAGLRNNVSVGMQYLAAWLRGSGAVGDLQPDGGRRHRGDLPLARSGSGCTTTSSWPTAQTVTRELVERIIDEELAKIRDRRRGDVPALGRRPGAVHGGGAGRRVRRVPHPARVRTDAVRSRR